MRTYIVATMVLSAIVTAAPAAADQGDWLVRLRAIVVAPQEKSGAVAPSFPGSHVGVDNSYAPEVDFTYMATNHIGAELILATTKHHVSGRDSLAGVGNLAGTWVLPPTLTLQYHFAPQAKIRPYLGAGVNYTVFYSSKASDGLEAAIGRTNVHLPDSFGYAVQGGFDVDLTKKIFANFDIKYVDIDTTARLTTGGAVNRVRVNLDPIIVGVGLGLRF